MTRLGLVAMALSTACFGGAHTRGDYPVGLLTPECNLVEKTPATERARDQILEAWTKRRARDEGWTAGLRAVGAELGLAADESDVPIVLRELRARIGWLLARSYRIGATPPEIAPRHTAATAVTNS